MHQSQATLVRQFYTGAGENVEIHLRTSAAKFFPLQELLRSY